MNIYSLFPTLVTENIALNHKTFKDTFLQNIFTHMSEDGKSNEHTGHVNIHKDYNFYQFFEFVISNIKEYISVLRIDPEIFNYAIVKSWFNITKDSDNPIHDHSDAHISFTYYINIPANIDKNFIVYNLKNINSLYSGMLRVCNISEYNMFNSTSWKISAEEGKLLVFPSALSHSVVSSKHAGPIVINEPGCITTEELISRRIAIAGDIILTYKNKANLPLGIQPISNWSIYE